MSSTVNPNTRNKFTAFYKNIYLIKKSYLDSCTSEKKIYQEMLKDNDTKNDRQARDGIQATTARIQQATKSFESFKIDCVEMFNAGRINKFW
ncbi:MAG: hypothetical protein HZA82_05960 [Thaumarchaeota archaeon]|nr:hypothetical protein [Nitrososphaerota archaeon]